MDREPPGDTTPDGEIAAVPVPEPSESLRLLAAILAGVPILAPTFVVAIGLSMYMTEYRPASLWAACGGGLAGAGLAIAVAFRTRRLCSSRRRAVIVSTAAGLLLLLPLLSFVWPGRIAASGFGWTVYGMVPVPTFDLAIGPGGIPWFRDKTHCVTLEEARNAVSPGVEVLVIGAGWDNVVKVDPAVRDLRGVEVLVAPTPEAFAIYNRLKSEGRRVALLAHSTC